MKQLQELRLKWPTYNDFDRIGEFYYSLAAIIIGNMFFVAYRFFEVYTLFNNHLPGTGVNQGFIPVASSFIAVVMIFAMLLIAVNRDQFKFPIAAEILGFVITLFINVYFWKVFNAPLWDSEWWFRIGMSLVSAAFDIAFAHILIKKIKEQGLIKLVADLDQRKADLDQSISRMDHDITRAKADLDQMTTRLKETTCQGCMREFDSKKARDSHKGKCRKYQSFIKK